MALRTMAAHTALFNPAELHEALTRCLNQPLRIPAIKRAGVHLVDGCLDQKDAQPARKLPRYLGPPEKASIETL
jgi:hypothetical protein